MRGASDRCDREGLISVDKNFQEVKTSSVVQSSLLLAVWPSRLFCRAKVMAVIEEDELEEITGVASAPS